MAALDEPTLKGRAVEPVNPALQRTLGIVLALTVLGIAAAFIFQQFTAAANRAYVPLQHFGKTVPEFQFTERSGRPFDSAAMLKGKIWLADFFFTSCPGPCLTMNGRMAEIQDAIREDKVADVRLVSFSIDPQTDTPEVLRRYADRFHAQQDRWYFLTGDKAKIYDLARNTFMLGVTDSTTGEEKLAAGEFVHSTKIVLVDRQGAIRGYYDSSSRETVQRVLMDLNSLLREQPPAL